MIGKLFICPQCKQEKTPGSEIIYCISCNMRANDFCSNKMKMEFAFWNGGKQELLDQKASFDIFKNVFSKAMEIYQE